MDLRARRGRVIAVAEPLAQIGWTGEGNVTGDPRVPVKCEWCLGARRLLEVDRRGAFGATPVLVVCSRCGGRGEYRIERRRR